MLMMLTILNEIFSLLLIITSALAAGGFLFTIRHKAFYSVWSRSSLLITAVSTATYCFVRSDLDTTLLELPYSQEVIFEMAHIGVLASLLSFIYTILRFKYHWQKDIPEGIIYCPHIDECHLAPKNINIIKKGS